ncbi:MAG: hypothetical protein JSW21_05315 [Gammaproteobacteria bacterium]|nr:MAG: hypothetical protein JSW21_05315 [Gammaproteobacteria bacterium]
MDALRHGKFRLVALLSVIVLGLGIAGCEGDDGDDGAVGATGPAGDAGLACWDLNGNGVGDFELDFAPFTEDINDDGVFDAFDCNAAAGGGGANPVESCAVCHGANAIADAEAIHVLTGVPTVSDVAFTLADANLVVTFKLQVDGRNASADDGFELNSGDRFFESAPGEYITEDIEEASTLSGGALGNFTITIEGGAAYADTNSRYEFRVQKGERPNRVRALVVADYPDVAYVDLVANEACQACHGPGPAQGIHRSYPMGAQQCVVCHADSERLEPGDDVGPTAPFVEIIHGIHNAHDFPEGFYEYVEADGESDIFETTFPSYMNNCSLCHSEPDMLAAANSMRVSPTCFTCHGTTETMFEEDDPIYSIHEGVESGCEICHAEGGPAQDYQVVTDVHNGSITGNDGVIWDGEDTSVTEGEKIVWEITGVADDGTDLTITWQASADYGAGPVGLDPCNADATDTAPVFFADDVTEDGSGGANLSIIRNYAQGQDFILGTRSDRAGQPSSTPRVTNTNTTCSGNVATTVVSVEENVDPDAMYGRVGIQGKPRIPNVDPEPEDPAFVREFGDLMPIRAKSPTFDWVIGEGGEAPDRRALVDTTEKCVKCHVGSLYQHGGNRVDNVDLCLLCHNTAANDQYVRVDQFGGVEASEAYDGRSGQAFGMREMLHAVHSAGLKDRDDNPLSAPIVIYRGRGIYAFAGDESQLNSWPTGDNCTQRDDDTGSNYFTVAGSDPLADADPCQPHNFHTPTYPRYLYDCAACHVDGFAVLPDPTKAMASTVETGNPPFGNQLNDVLEGITASSCMTCHTSSDGAVQSALKAHAYQNGWTPQAFQEGRQTIIEANQ